MLKKIVRYTSVLCLIIQYILVLIKIIYAKSPWFALANSYKFGDKVAFWMFEYPDYTYFSISYLALLFVSYLITKDKWIKYLFLIFVILQLIDIWWISTNHIERSW